MIDTLSRIIRVSTKNRYDRANHHTDTMYVEMEHYATQLALRAQCLIGCQVEVIEEIVKRGAGPPLIPLDTPPDLLLKIMDLFPECYSHLCYSQHPKRLEHAVVMTAIESENHSGDSFTQVVTLWRDELLRRDRNELSHPGVMSEVKKVLDRVLMRDVTLVDTLRDVLAMKGMKMSEEEMRKYIASTLENRRKGQICSSRPSIVRLLPESLRTDKECVMKLLMLSSSNWHYVIRELMDDDDIIKTVFDSGLIETGYPFYGADCYGVVDSDTALWIRLDWVKKHYPTGIIHPATQRCLAKNCAFLEWMIANNPDNLIDRAGTDLSSEYVVKLSAHLTPLQEARIMHPKTSARILELAGNDPRAILYYDPSLIKHKNMLIDHLSRIREKEFSTKHLMDFLSRLGGGLSEDGDVHLALMNICRDIQGEPLHGNAVPSVDEVLNNKCLLQWMNKEQCRVYLSHLAKHAKRSDFTAHKISEFEHIFIRDREFYFELAKLPFIKIDMKDRCFADPRKSHIDRLSKFCTIRTRFYEDMDAMVVLLPTVIKVVRAQLSIWDTEMRGKAEKKQSHTGKETSTLSHIPKFLENVRQLGITELFDVSSWEDYCESMKEALVIGCGVSAEHGPGCDTPPHLDYEKYKLVLDAKYPHLK